ncbi:efflux RND transporter permease subunit [Shewanella sp. 1_MG-2023]|uniref:efflux RND transporter permease subunit n=1 Tax=unclassified Shewanella TaxID=196818 RepID=UPI0026E26F01|nr:MULTISPECIES: efflux RND transporter permease subunit [unclassified Shewanella]MDO6611415.1 efflux RND transporter permease subunit [Shewanella sp. 7_MG-2023]MDO6771270.1 efflux RND transporter permease subunit [Shewanella sp. 2_MG-2023]MDO6795511.1 efflux RND transporter permease subunit [Shewanella sp. 1_MG-2023]
MNIAGYFVKNTVISWMFTLILLIGGLMAFTGLGQLEDPPFTIKDAVVVTLYPGATSTEVEEEVTYPIEKAIQALPYVDYIRSLSTSGMSQITVTMKNIYGPEELPQIWDELRRKVNDMSASLPPGVQTPIVNDDFGDVYGIMLMVSGADYSYRDILDYVDYVKRELELVPGVGKVSLAGNQQEQVFVEMSLNKAASSNIDPSLIQNLLNSQNMVSDAGNIRVSADNLKIRTSGGFKSVSELEELIIPGTQGNKLIYLKDVATVSRGFQNIPTNLLKFDQHDAINIGISFSTGVNVVEVGKAIDAKLASIESVRPAGMVIETMYNQPNEVDASVGSFVWNLIAAVVIVVGVLLVFMGFKSGILIGLILFLTCLGTFMLMLQAEIELQRISLGALIIALGMLVDNAIVIVEGILIGRQRGQTTLEAAQAIVKQTMWPLLGATVIAITAFAPIGLSPDSTGEFAGSLFWVLLFSLFLSWITAITITPFFAQLFFGAEGEKVEGELKDPYGGAFFVFYKMLLDLCMRFRWVSVISVVIAFCISIYGFAYVKQSFFPPSTTPMFLVDVWMPEGTDIRETQTVVEGMESIAVELDNVEFVASTIGKGFPRFLLTYSPEKNYASYAQISIRTTDFETLTDVMVKFRKDVETDYPQAQLKFKRLEIGPSTDAKIEARISGADPDVLRSIAAQVMEIFNATPATVNVRHDWRERVKYIAPRFNETQARRLGIVKSEVDEALKFSFTGMQIGVYREGTTLLPIIGRLPEDERIDIESMESIRIWSPALSAFVPLQQVVDGFEVKFEDPIIQRRDRKRTLTVFADTDFEYDILPAELFKTIKPKVEALELPVGYELQWGGEYESSSDAQESLFATLPLGFLFMFLITVFLFNSVRKPLVIWACVPLAIIGITSGLLILDKPFSFMALLGMLSLSGMLLKNGIVLLDQINTDINNGIETFEAVFNSTVSRVRPVCMAAITTILGVLPLLTDAFFESLAAVVMFGLGVATILTLIIVPVFYLIIFKVKYRNYKEF